MAIVPTYPYIQLNPLSPTDDPSGIEAFKNV